MAEAVTVTTPQPTTSPAEPPAAWAGVQGLACELTVDLALPGVKVRDLMRMERNMVIDSHWQLSADVPIRVNGELIAWSEFEVVGQRLAVRVTELA
jgi:flagellar motor switch/type III secretory pathway protein FliN